MNDGRLASRSKKEPPMVLKNTSERGKKASAISATTPFGVAKKEKLFFPATPIVFPRKSDLAFFLLPFSQEMVEAAECASQGKNSFPPFFSVGRMP